MEDKLTKVEMESVSTMEMLPAVEYINTLIASKSLPPWIKNYEQAAVISEMGKGAGFTPMQSFQWITQVEGTLTINAKGVGVLLKRAGYILKVIHDAAYVLEDKSIEEIVELVAKKREDGKISYYYDKITGKRLINRITEIEYTNKTTGEKGRINYYKSDADAAELTSKSVWKKYLKAMMMNRCKTKMASYLGLLFLPESEEFAAENNVNIVVDEDGVVLPDNKDPKMTISI